MFFTIVIIIIVNLFHFYLFFYILLYFYYCQFILVLFIYFTTWFVAFCLQFSQRQDLFHSSYFSFSIPRYFRTGSSLFHFHFISHTPPSFSLSQSHMWNSFPLPFSVYVRFPFLSLILGCRFIFVRAVLTWTTTMMMMMTKTKDVRAKSR